MADNNEARVYILRSYDRKLVVSGFRCVMVTGSHYAGTTIVEGSESWNKDIIQGTVKTYQSGSSEFTTVSGKKYNFDSFGTSNDNQYRLMLIEDKSKGSSEEIAEYLKAINETLAEYVSSVDRNIKEAKRIAEDAKSAVNSMESAIENLDERVTALEDKEDE